MMEVYVFLSSWVGSFLASLLIVLGGTAGFIAIVFGIVFTIIVVATWHDDCTCKRCVENVTREKMEAVLRSKKREKRYDMETEVSKVVKEWEKTLR